MQALLDRYELQRRIDASPVNRWLGITVEALDDAGVTLRMAVRPDMIGSPGTGVLHGGLMGCLIDTAGSFAVIAMTGQTVATVDFRVDFHSPQRGDILFASTEILKLGKRLASVEVRVKEADGCLLASGRAVYMNAPLKST